MKEKPKDKKLVYKVKLINIEKLKLFLLKLEKNKNICLQEK